MCVGKPVSGKVHLTVFTNDSLLEVKATHQVDGVAQLEMRFNKEFKIYEQPEEVNLNFTFTEQYTNRSIAKSLKFTVYKTNYIAQLVKETPGFLPGQEFTATVKMEHRDGSPARSVNCAVEVVGLEETFDETFATDDEGEITHEFTPTENDDIYIKVSVGENEILDETIEREQQNAEAIFKITNVNELQLSQPIKLQVTCRQKVKFLVYYVVSKGNVILQDFIRSKKDRFDLTLKYSDNMVPEAKVLVVTVANNTVVYGIKDIVFPGLLNNLEMELEDNEVKLGEQIQLEIVARPASYVALAAYDKSLLKYGSTHDLYYSDVHQLYESFHQIDKNEFDVFQAFYIVDHLPYSIKRGEVVTLQFTIFNNLGADFITEVMLENVQDQMEFVEQPTSSK
uniref:Alpha-2-macroglobulin bait region domain-containing protein n=1 Tax=Anopheles atroparvus TaxID=41427 RepID=A0A182IKJ5_ANOAO